MHLCNSIAFFPSNGITSASQTEFPLPPGTLLTQPSHHPFVTSCHRWSIGTRRRRRYGKWSQPRQRKRQHDRRDASPRPWSCRIQNLLSPSFSFLSWPRCCCYGRFFLVRWVNFDGSQWSARIFGYAIVESDVTAVED